MFWKSIVNSLFSLIEATVADKKKSDIVTFRIILNPILNDDLKDL